MKVQFELTMIADWRKAWKLYSVWIFSLLLALPDLYNAAISSNLITADHVPVLFSRLVNIIGFVGIASRIVKQKSNVISALPEDLQAKVALGLLSQDQADAEEAERAQLVATAAAAAPPAPAPAIPAVLVISPVPAIVQDAVDTANAQAAAAAPAPADALVFPAAAAAPVTAPPMAAVLNAVAEPTPAPVPVAAPVAPAAPVVPATLADTLNATSTLSDVAAAVQQKIDTEFTAAQKIDVVVHGRVMDRVIALTQEFTAKVESLKAAIEKAL